MVRHPLQRAAPPGDPHRTDGALTGKEPRPMFKVPAWLRLRRRSEARRRLLEQIAQDRQEAERIAAFERIKRQANQARERRWAP
jgi:hypothetical protein